MSMPRRALLAALPPILAATLPTVPARAQGRDATPAGATGRVFINEAGGVRIHTYMAPLQGALVTSHLIETADGLVLVDGQFQPGPAQELARYIAATGQRLARVLLTHAHPDHWFGFHHLGRPAIHAGPVTAQFLRSRGAQLVAERRADSSPPDIAAEITPGTERIGGVELRYRLVIDTEAPEMLVVELPQAGAAILGDLLYNRVHNVVSRTVPNWIAVLENLAANAPAPLLLPGHGEPTAPARLADAVRYLKAVQPLMQGAGPDRIKPIAAQMGQDFPDWRMLPLLELGLSRALGA